jgi:hypothetical protein
MIIFSNLIFTITIILCYLLYISVNFTISFQGFESTIKERANLKCLIFGDVFTETWIFMVIYVKY